MEDNIASLIKFNDLCKVFETTRNLKKQDKSQAITDFIKLYREKVVALKNLNPNANTSFYPVLRLILPQLERERGPYGLKEYTLAKRFIRILCLPPSGTDAMRITNFRSSSSDPNAKDFADVAYWVLRKHFLNASKLSIADVNKYLDAIAERHSNNDPRGVDDQLLRLFQESSWEEHPWLIRIILNNVRLGVGQDRILKLYHPDAADLFSTNNSLSKVCETLMDSSVRLHEIEISVFAPFRPMLSQKCDLTQSKKIFASNRNIYIETKFDGERFQLHMKNGQFKYFSRNGYDYTDTYGANFATGLYTPLLKNVFKSNVQKIILDGEMMGWNTTTKKFGSKGMEFDVKHLKLNSVHQPCFCVFDILLLNDDVLTNKPLRDRLLILDTVLVPKQGVIICSHRIEASSKVEVLQALNNSMDREEEGIVFKDIMSLYKSNDRNAGWWKMKLEYFENVMSDLDLLVIGGYYGEGRYSNRITGFLVGVAVPSKDTKNDQIPLCYLSLAKVASGLNDEELNIVEKKLGPHWKKINEGDRQQYGLQWGKEKPDVWIPPNKSCVVLVRASELIHSSDFKTEYTLRFPRIQKLRFDKPYYDCLSTIELEELTSSSKPVHKLTKRHLDLSDLEISEKVKKIRKKFVNVEMQPVVEISDLLKGHEFCVLTGNEEWDKDKVETEIRRNGGKIVRNEGTETLCILVGKNHPRVNICKQQDTPCDLVRLQWLSNILNTGVFIMFTPKDMLHTSKITRERFLTEYDKYGDSYIEDTTLDNVQHIVESVQQIDKHIFLMPTEINSIEKELNMFHPLNVFKTYVAYFDKQGKNYKIHSDMVYPRILEEIEFKFLGGIIKTTLDKDVTVVVMDTSEELKKKEILEYLFQINNTQAKIMSKTFIRKKLEEVYSALCIY